MTKTEQAIRREFPGQANAGLRKDLRTAIASGDPGVVRMVGARVAFSAAGRASLLAVLQALESEVSG